jgi:hypothetical protein
MMLELFYILYQPCWAVAQLPLIRGFSTVTVSAWAGFLLLIESARENSQIFASEMLNRNVSGSSFHVMMFGISWCWKKIVYEPFNSNMMLTDTDLLLVFATIAGPGRNANTEPHHAANVISSCGGS